ncbi:unknown [Clostridium sp. CAG:306]|nr:unknown [Clostridium sp. CAG:306]
MAKYKVKHTSIMHNKKLYIEGSTVELTDEQAKRLEDFVELIPETKTTKPETKSKTDSKQTNKTTETKNETVKTDGNDGGKTDDK